MPKYKVLSLRNGGNLESGERDTAVGFDILLEYPLKEERKVQHLLSWKSSASPSQYFWANFPREAHISGIEFSESFTSISELDIYQG